jgi:branched-chain amino acid transport system permease protein
MTAFVQYLISGLAAGSIYAIIALGFVLVFKATDVFNFAQGSLMMMGAFFSLTALSTLGLPLVPAVLLVLLASALVGILMHLLVIRPMLGQPLLTLVMATFAVSLIVKALIAMSYGATEKSLPTKLPDDVLLIAGVRVSVLDLITIGVSLACMLGFGLFFRRTSLGLQMRATAENSEAAMLSGIDVNRVFVVTFAIAVALAALGGFLLANVQLVSSSLADLGLLALPAAVVGGLTSIPGAVTGGLLVGVLQSLGAGYVSASGRDVFVYLVLLLVLLVRPWGLMGTKEIVRV